MQKADILIDNNLGKLNQEHRKSLLYNPIYQHSNFLIIISNKCFTMPYFYFD